MGYNVREGLVSSYEAEFTLILDALEREDPNGVSFNVPLEQLHTEQYRLRRALKATEVFVTECDGRFAGLGKVVTVHVDTDNGLLHVVPKNGVKHRATLDIYKPSEHDALTRFEDYPGDMQNAKFWPSDSFTPAWIIQQLSARGWEIVNNKLLDNPDGSLEFVAQRKQTSGDAYERLGFGRKTS